jgi:hypothetical protein
MLSMIESPQVRPGKVGERESTVRLIAMFSNSALGNSAIQQLIVLGLPQDRLGVTPPEKIEGGQGMVLSIACPTPKLLLVATEVCRQLGATIREQRGTP